MQGESLMSRGIDNVSVLPIGMTTLRRQLTLESARGFPSCFRSRLRSLLASRRGSPRWWPPQPGSP